MAHSGHRPLRNILLSLLAFLLLDAALFRSGLYAHVQSPYVVAGKFYWWAWYEKRRPADRGRDVLAIGNSKFENGFGVREHELAHPEDPLRFLNGGSPASELRWWYYMLRDVDPRQDRYRAIVIPLNGYLARPDTYLPDAKLTFSLIDEFTSALALAPFLGIADWPTLIASYDSPAQRLKVLRVALFASHAYAADVADLLMDPLERLFQLAARATIGARWMYNSHGEGPRDLTGLRFDADMRHVLAWPSQFDPIRHVETERLLIPPPDPEASTQRYIRYSVRWLQAIFELYRHSDTRIIIAPITAYAMPLPAVAPIPGAPDLRALLRDVPPNVTFLDEAPYAALARPELFFDTLHFNTPGRLLFTEQLTGDVAKALSATGAPRP